MGNIVPSNLDKYLKEKIYKSGGDDGFMDRIELLIYPSPVKNWKYIDRETNYQELHKVTEIRRALHESTFVTKSIKAYTPFLCLKYSQNRR